MTTISFPRTFLHFAKSFFAKATGGGFTLAPKTDDTKKGAATQPAEGAGNKHKPTGNEQEGKKKKRKKNDKSLKMGLFHIKKGTPAAKVLPDKSLLKDRVGVCMDFCCHEKKCSFPHMLCRNGKHYTNWKNVPDEDKIILLKYMDSTGLLWLNAETFKKHKITIPPKYAHLLGNATGPKKNEEAKYT